MNKPTLTLAALALLLTPLAAPHAAEPVKVSLSAIGSPVILRGDATTAYRDPAAIYQDGWFRLFFTLVKIEAGGRPFFPEQDPRGGFDNFASIGLAWSSDLKSWAWPDLK